MSQKNLPRYWTRQIVGQLLIAACGAVRLTAHGEGMTAGGSKIG